jgi:hypothetical protein
MCDAKQRFIEKFFFKQTSWSGEKAFNLKMLLQMISIIINKRFQKPRRLNLKFSSAVNIDNEIQPGRP